MMWVDNCNISFIVVVSLVVSGVMVSFVMMLFINNGDVGMVGMVVVVFFFMMNWGFG
jgi:hypothetical protein